MKQSTSFFNLSIYLTLFSVIFFAYVAYSSNLPQQNLTEQYSQAAHYLQCYPLNLQNKEQCIQKLDKYVPSTYKADSTLYKQFVYDMERLGFANFLIKHGKECQKIDAGPIYSEATAAYEVHCINKEKKIKVFYMQFDYEKEQWNIIDVE